MRLNKRIHEASDIKRGPMLTTLPIGVLPPLIICLIAINKTRRNEFDSRPAGALIGSD
ncbi:hypothetical protein [Paenibacillus sp. YIM B09110]|uniref:hypothetical protein n=1 Tax=Paenibacillus sp. YIM B09110 TaxID=3126102 RepID=UPI00301C10C8